MIQVQINGKAHTLPSHTTITQMLEALGYQKKWLGVAVNSTFVAKEKHHTTPLKEGDHIEILAPMSGG